MTERTSIHGQWSSRLIFVLAAAGSAVGLGNIWKFPYITGEYGGGAFVLVYLLCIAVIGLPVMMVEILLGRRGRQSPINTMKTLAKEEQTTRLWSWIGWSGVISGFLILSFYSVIAGWALAYVFKAVSGTFNGINAAQVGDLFGAHVGSWPLVLLWHTVFILMTVFVVARGVRAGLEKAVTFLMPLLLALLLVLVGYSMAEGDFARGFSFLFSPDFKKVFYSCSVEGGIESCAFNGEPLLTAMGHAFFTLSLGMGAIMVYGSYMPKRTSITGSALLIVFMDTLVALLAGLAIFPLVFGNNLEPGAGPGLIFQTLPIAFGAMTGGQLFGTLFFVLLVFAAWTSSISLVEPAVAWLVENRGIRRTHAAAWIGFGCWLLGLGTVFSFNLMSGEEYQIAGKTIFDLLDFVTTNILLPVGGLAMALFTGWFASRRMSESELGLPDPWFSIWWFVVRFITPVGVLIIFLHAIGVL
jgi:neurotransmitter:Na+ symporter, NSS family